MKWLSELSEQFDQPINPLYTLKNRWVREGRSFTDLVSGDVTSQGIQFPAKVLQEALQRGQRRSRIYRPDPFGQREAREALSRYYRSEGLKIPANHLLLTPGTSLAYDYAFKLTANSGDEILTPVPSYPLCESIAAFCGIKLVGYRLREEARWQIDFDHLIRQISPRTRAVILVSPHNPTGAVATQEEIRKLSEIAAANKLAIISDEVFSPFVFASNVFHRPASQEAPLVITLNGFSKMLALPGLKIGWMALTGQARLVEKSLKTLEIMADTFLPVNEAAQFAVPFLLENSRSFQTVYRSLIGKRKDLAVSMLKGIPGLTVKEPEGGFFLTLRLNSLRVDEEEVACRLLRDHRILMHPGYFYDMEGQHLVLSYTSRPALLRKTLDILLGEIS